MWLIFARAFEQVRIPEVLAVAVCPIAEPVPEPTQAMHRRAASHGRIGSLPDLPVFNSREVIPG